MSTFLSPPFLPHCNHSDVNYEKNLTEIYSTFGDGSQNEPDAPTEMQGSQFFIKKQQMKTNLPGIVVV